MLCPRRKLLSPLNILHPFQCHSPQRRAVTSGADDTCRPLATAKFRTIYRTCEKVNLLITMLTMIGQCQAAIRGFSSFPAGSLPRRRFGPRVACKVLIENDFSIRGEPRKNFYPEFPCAAGKARGGPTLPSLVPLRRGRLRLGPRGFLHLATARDRKHRRSLRSRRRALCSCATQPERAYVAFPQQCKPLIAKESGKLLFPYGHNPCHTRFR
jgi:hypothetical protein